MITNHPLPLPNVLLSLCSHFLSVFPMSLNICCRRLKNKQCNRFWQPPFLPHSSIPLISARCSSTLLNDHTPTVQLLNWCHLDAIHDPAWQDMPAGNSQPNMSIWTAPAYQWRKVDKIGKRKSLLPGNFDQNVCCSFSGLLIRGGSPPILKWYPPN